MTQNIYRLLFEQSIQPMLLVQHERIIQANQEASTLLNCVTELLVGQTLLAISPQTQPNGNASTHMLAVKLAELAQSSDNHLSFAWQFQPEQTVISAVVTAQSIQMATERYTLFTLQPGLSNIFASTQQLNEVIDLLPDPTFAIDLEGRLIIWNKAIAEMSGTPASAVLGKANYEYAIPFYGERRPVLVDLVLNQDVEFVKKYPFITRTDDSLTTEVFTPYFKKSKGAYVWANARPLYDSQGNIVGAIESVRDITEQYETRRMLQKQEQQLRDYNQALHAERDFLHRVIDANPHLIFAKDGDGAFVLVNQQFARFYHDTPKNIAGKTEFDLLDDPLLIEKYIRDDREVLVTQQPKFISETMVIDPEGQPYWFQMIKVPLRGRDGASKQVLGVGTDITQRKLLEQKVQQSLERRTRQIRWINNIIQETISATTLDELYQRVVTRLYEGFELYHVQLYRYNQAKNKLILVAASGEIGKTLLANNHQLALNQLDIGADIIAGKSYLQPDLAILQRWSPEPYLPSAQGEIVVPLKIGEQTTMQIFGCLRVVSDVSNHFEADDLLVLEVLTNQVSVAIENLRLLEEATIFRQFAESTGQGFGMATLAGETVYSNPAAARIFGVSDPTELYGQPFLSHYPETLHSLIETEVLPTVLEEGQWRGELALKLKDGSTIPVLENIFVIHNNHGQPYYLANVFVDITARKQIEADLMERLQELSTLQQLMTHEGWQTYHQTTALGYLFNPTDHQIEPIPTETTLVKRPFSITEITVRDEVVGQIGVYEDSEQPLSTDERSLIDVITTQMAEALDNARLLEQTHKRAVELAAVAQVSTAVSTILKIDTLLQTVVDLTKDSFDLYYAQIYLYDASITPARLTLTAGTGTIGQQLVAEGWEISTKQINAIIVKAARHQQGVIENDVSTTQDFLQNPLLPETRSELAVPIIAAGNLLGVLDVQSNQINNFTTEDIKIFTTLATQVGGAIRNAQLFETVTLARAKAENRLKENQILQQLSQTLTATLALDKITEAFFDACTDLLGFEFAILSLVDPDHHRIQAIAGRNVTQSHIERANYPLDGDDIVADIIRTGMTEIVQTGDAWFKQLNVETATPGKWDTLVFMPIIFRQNNIGLVEVGFNQPINRDLQGEQLRLLRAFIDQVALAIRSAQRYAISQKDAQHLALLNQMGTTLNQTTTMPEIFQVSLSQIPSIIEADYVTIALLQGNYFTVFALDPNNPNTFSQTRCAFDETALGQTISENELLVFSEFTKTNFVDLQDLADTQNLHSGIIAPLIAGGVGLGTLNIARQQPQAFSKADEQLMLQIIPLLASVIESRRLFEQIQAALAETETLYELTGLLSGAVSVEDALHVAISSAIVSGLNYAYLFTISSDTDSEPEKLRMIASWETKNQGLIPIGTEFDLANYPSTAEWFMVPDEPLLINNINQVNEIDPNLATLYHQMDTIGLVALPLKLGLYWVGVIIMSWSNAQSFTERDQRLYQSIMAQTTVVVNNLLLFEQTQARAAQLEQLSQVEMQLSLAITEADILNSVSLLTTGLPNSAIALNYLNVDEVGKPYSQSIVAVLATSDDGKIPATWEVGTTYLLEHDALSTLWVNKPDQVVFIDDILVEPTLKDNFPPLLQHGEWRAFIMMPLFIGATWQGMLAFAWPEPYHFESNHKFLFEKSLEPISAVVASRRAYLAQQAALAQTETQAKRLALLNQFGAELNASHTVEQIFNSVIDTLPQIIYCEHTSIILFDKSDKSLQNFAHRHTGQTFPVANTLIEQALQQKQPLIVRNFTEHKMADARQLVQSGYLSGIAAPLMVGGTVLGTLNILSRQQNRFTNQDANLLQQAASLVAATMENQRLLEATQQQAERERLVNDISQKIQQTTSLESALQTAVEALGEAFQARQVAVELTDFE